MKKIILGCFGDDFTGSSDAASFIKKGGLHTILINGIPDEDYRVPEGTEAIVIALKTRTEMVETAVEESTRAYEWFRGMGIQHVYDKYCSTFDSTMEGNIGPIADAIMVQENLKYTILCPALPQNKRIVKGGVLYVNGVRLEDSHMRKHPLTPMLISEIAVLMEQQSKFQCVSLDCELLEKPDAEILNYIEDYGKDKAHFYVIPDYVEEIHARKITSLFGNLSFLTGGSGLLTELSKSYKADQDDVIPQYEAGVRGKGLILAGSCSSITLGQINSFIENGGRAIMMDPKRMMGIPEEMERIWAFIRNQPEEAVLVFSSDEPESIVESQDLFGREMISEKLENSMAELADLAVKEGYTRIIVAGGETSGAVTKRLGFKSYYISDDIGPGVPIMIPVERPSLRLVLKSGSFGQNDFFSRALDMTSKREGVEK